MLKIYMLNFHIFTGGPGAGKTSVLNALAQKGYATVREVAREIIQKQHATGGNATHQGNRIVYRDLMLQQSIEDFLVRRLDTNPIFFDRGIPDLLSYTKRFCDGENQAINEAVTHYRYNPHVFIFPPWAEIYCHDEERKQSLDEAVDTFHAVWDAYTSCGYELITVPQGSVEQRVEFILHQRANHEPIFT